VATPATPVPQATINAMRRTQRARGESGWASVDMPRV
jgi:hypothetical protein